jgi:hypothetical protein
MQLRTIVQLQVHNIWGRISEVTKETGEYGKPNCVHITLCMAQTYQIIVYKLTTIADMIYFGHSFGKKGGVTILSLSTYDWYLGVEISSQTYIWKLNKSTHFQWHVLYLKLWIDPVSPHLCILVLQRTKCTYCILLWQQLTEL